MRISRLHKEIIDNFTIEYIRKYTKIHKDIYFHMGTLHKKESRCKSEPVIHLTSSFLFKFRLMEGNFEDACVVIDILLK